VIMAVGGRSHCCDCHFSLVKAVLLVLPKNGCRTDLPKIAKSVNVLLP
jgi:hypothetical protein